MMSDEYGVFLPKAAFGVCSTSRVHWPAVEARLFRLLPEVEAGEATCDVLASGKCRMDCEECVLRIRYYADKPWTRAEDCVWHAPGAGLVLKVHVNWQAVEVLLSPVVEPHAQARVRWVGRGDLGRMGSVPTFTLPAEYLEQSST